ncbi:F0F1 ATP synthase subunit gamma [Dokdonella fugitiva]|jgi:F-type H+-transporting ATPase subunit gamma|uniref:ATP synthase gamma chain n=1 Tax=Dokdonella fugitiva TaxID=328517 RepID=A0A4R2IA34_9GAMM|nr:F0F1 ATP synthase subunit gamma [Dokdonella fugitiva]MBA8883570.1 F-type H+-transporting ATPase subunit gamma [Dokdonella fugitiva]TCO41313.1 F-type H+-transporting ATPase subunit gamma [Dokdonella fugitiva]
MAGAREIRTKIKSVANTRKVTRALEMVSASKIRKAQDLMKASRPYARLMRQVIGHIAHANVEFQHPFLVERKDVKRVGYVIVSTDRGLCGGLNSNMFRKLLGEIRGWQDKGVEVDVVCIGQKATQFFRRLKVNMLGSVTHLGEKPQIAQLIGVIKVVLDAYTDGRIDRLHLAYNDFVNTMTQKATVDTLLPLPPSPELATTHAWDYIYEPDAATVLEHVLTRYIESLVYQSVLENLASEHAARMVAMKSASDNATKAIGSLTLVYNKARQAAITQEISEIVGGAAAV